MFYIYYKTLYSFVLVHHIKMGLFRKKDKKKEVPSLPELPKLPDFPRLEDDESLSSKESIHQLPGFPSNSLGRKFSQDSIKDAVAGEKDVGGSEVDEFDMTEDMRGIRDPLRKSRTKEIPFRHMDEEDVFMEKDVGIHKTTRRDVEPVFIRIDRFEEGLHIFEDTKKKISEIERALGETKRIKEKEEKELQDWENEIRTIKNQIEKIDEDIFSKI